VSGEPAPPERQLIDALVLVLAEHDAAARKARLDAIGLSHDERAAVALAYIAMHDRDAAVAERAVAVLGGIGSRAAFGELTWVARAAKKRSAVWERAVDALGTAGAAAAADALIDLVTDGVVRIDVRRRARAVLEKHYPEVAAARAVPKVSGNLALPLLGGAAFGGYTLGTVGTFSKTGAGPIIGTLAGAVIGGTAGYLVSGELTTERSAHYVSSGVWGLYSGLLVAPLARERPSTKLVLGLGLAGELAGLSFGYLSGDRFDYDLGDVALIDLNGVVAVGAAAGAGDLLSLDARPHIGLILASSLVTVGVTGALAKRSQFDSADRMLVALAAAEGAWLGGSAAQLADGGNMIAAASLGGGLALLSSEILVQHLTLDRSLVSFMLATSIYGKALGGGIALLGDAGTDAAVVAQLATGAVGLGLGAALDERLVFTGGDVSLIPTATFLGVWHGLSIGFILEDDGKLEARQVAGLTLTMGAAAGVTAMAAAQVTDFSPWSVGMGSVGALWGAWFGAWGANLADADRADQLTWTLVASDLGLVASALLVSPAVEINPTVVGGASLGGLATAGVATLVASLATEDTDALIATNIIGSAAGLLIGGLVTAAVIGPTVEEAPAPDSSPVSLLPGNAQLTLTPAINPRGEADGMLLTLVFIDTPAD